MRRDGGWLLIEILVMLTLISVLLLAESRLFVSVVRQWSGTRQAETQVAQFDHAIRQLRADAWGAQRFEIDDDGTRLVLHRDDGTTTWATEATVTRDAAGELKRWNDLGQTLRFAASGPRLMVTTRSTMGTEAEFVVASQVMLAGVAR